MQKRFLKVMTFAALTFIGAYLSAFQRIMEALSSRFSDSMVLSGTMVSFHFIGVFIGPLVTGELSDRFGKKAVISCAFLLYTVGLVLILYSPGVAVLMAGVLLAGAAFGTLEGVLTAALTDMEPANSSRVIMISQIFMCAGTVAGPFIATASINLTGGWRALYAIWLAVSVALALFYALSRYPLLPVEQKSTGTLSGKLLRQPFFLLLCLCILLYVGVEEGLAFWMTSYITSSAMQQAYADWALPCFWIGMTVGKPMFIGMSGKTGKKIALLAVAATGVILLITFLKLPLLLVLSFFAIGFTISGIFPFVMTMAGKRYPQCTGTAFGIIMSSCAVGGIAVPFLMGILNEVSGYMASLLLCAALLLCVAVIIGFSSRGAFKTVGRSEVPTQVD